MMLTYMPTYMSSVALAVFLRVMVVLVPACAVPESWWVVEAVRVTLPDTADGVRVELVLV